MDGVLGVSPLVPLAILQENKCSLEVLKWKQAYPKYVEQKDQKLNTEKDFLKLL